MALTQEDKDRLLLVADQIEQQPELYDQDVFHAEVNVCGGACCMLGWAVWNDNPDRFCELAKTTSATSGAWSDESTRLFGWRVHLGLWSSGGAWPEPYRRQYFRARTRKQKSLIGAKLLRDFVAADGNLNFRY